MRRLLALFIVVVTALTLCGVASAAPRRVPFGFFGVVVDPELTVDTSPAVLDSQMSLMAQSGVESVRTNFFWEGIEPAPGLYSWAQTDAVVEAAAEHHLQLLPILEFTPQWASSHPSSAWPYYAPSNPGTFASFVTALVDRYGSHGSFWSANPTVPRDPIKYWQIWNEPEGTQYDWRSAPWPSTYTTLLKAAYTAIHHADHAARVVSGALVALNGTNLTQWAEARALYRAGFKRYFDVLAVNAFTNAPSVTASVDRSVKILTLVRDVMRQHHDGATPIWVTELTWTAALGQIPPSEYAGFETTPAGQAARMTAYYRLVASRRPDGIARAFWYTWWSPYVAQPLFGNSPTFQYTGLVKWQPGQPFQAEPLLSTYTRVAAQFEGCRKSTDAARCR